MAWAIGAWAIVALPGVGSAAAPRGELAAAKLASVSGRVSAADTGQGVTGITVGLLHLDGSLVEQTLTGTDGRYFKEIPPGTYHVRVFGRFGLLGGLFDGISCPFFCNPKTATPVTVSGRTTGIDFVMKPAGRLSGRVTDASSGQPLADTFVYVFDHTGQQIQELATGRDGRYLTRDLPAGTYFVATRTNLGARFGSFDPDAYLDRVYDGRPCLHGLCNPLTGTPVKVSLGVETTGVDFALTRGGSVSGTVRDEASGDPIAGARVAVRDARGRTLAEGESDAAGRYTASGLIAGDFFVLALAAADHPGELYDGVACAPTDCDLSQGTPVSVALDDDTDGVDFTVERTIGRGSLSGKIVEQGSGQAIADIGIVLMDYRFLGIATTFTGADGAYRFDEVQAGTFYLRTFNNLAYFDEIYDELPCGSVCNVRDGAPVTVEAGVETGDVDFELVKGGHIFGRVTDDAGRPVAAQVTAYDEEGGFVGSAFNAHPALGGRFDLRPLPAGRYFVVAVAFESRFAEVFGAGPCYRSECDVTAGRPVDVELGGETGGVDFVVDPGLTLSGRVVDRTTGKDLPFSFQTDVYTAAGVPVGSDFGGQGRYTFTGLLPGSYYVATSNLAGFVDEVHAGVECPFSSCDVTSGTLVTVDAGVETDDVDFALARGGSISGTLTELATGLPFRNVAWIEAIDASGNRVAFELVDFNGNYKLSGLPGGSYFVSASSPVAPGELHGGVPCVLDCDVTDGTPVDVRPGRDTPDVDFALALGGRFTGTITSRTTGDVVSDARVEIFHGDGSPAFSTVVYRTGARAITVEPVYLVGALPAGTYFVRVSADGFAGQLFDGVPCAGECDVTAGTAVTIRVNEETTGVDFVLDVAVDP